MTNLGDLVVTIFYLAVAAVIITAVVLFSRSHRKQKEQLDRIEDQLNHLIKK
ncbi:hypothetical protein [Bhargavaea cecembensis]|uniref:hypothetical protein n=1 Tax=Bhargavaea cecembensis TaxID=394098 RepID=UPI0012E7731B|nr:hypothetical protein [Bhargavaea cecembensis]